MKTIFGNSFIYMFSTGLGIGMPFLLMPVLTRYLSVEAYGLTAMFATFVSLAGIVVGLNVQGTVTRCYFDKGRVLKDCVSAAIFILICSFIMVEILVWIFSSQLETIFSIPPSWLYIAVVAAFFTFVLHIQLALYQVKEQVKSYAKVQLVYAFVNAFFTLLLVVTFTFGAQGRLFAQSISVMLIGVLSFYLLYKAHLFSFKLRKSYIREALYFGVPLVPHAIGGMLLLGADRVIVNNSLGLNYAGFYMVAVQISLGFNLIGASFNKAFVPRLYMVLMDGVFDEKLKIVKLTYIVFLLYMAITILLCLFTDELLLFLAGEKYLIVSPVLKLLFIMQGIHGLYYMVTNYLFYKVKNSQLAATTIVLGVFNVALSLALVEQFGMEGVAFSSLISISLQFLAVWYLANKYYPMPWFDRRAFKL